MDIFRTLMRTRKMPIHFEHVGALNLVEIEFVKESKVITAWKAYLDQLGKPYPKAGDTAAQEEVGKRRDSLLTKLIHEIAMVLNFKVEQLDILEGNYLPQGWNDDDWILKQVRQGLLEVVSGRRPLVVQPFSPPQANIYPPAPTAEQVDTGSGEAVGANAESRADQVS